MSRAGRQILSSPFDWDVHSGDRKLEEDGRSVATSNIMVDTRVVRRRTFNASSTKNDADAKFSTDQPGCIKFDSRLMSCDIFANPIVTVTDEDAKKQVKETPACGRRTVSTPPPVKGRRHISVQTVDDTDTSDVGACERANLIESCTQTISRCTLQQGSTSIEI